MLGEISALASAVAWAGSGTLAKVLTHRMGVLALTALRTMVGAVFILLVALAAGRAGGILHLPLENLLFLLASNVVYVGGDLCFFGALSRVDVSRVFPTSTLLYIFLSVLASALVARQPIHWTVGLGAVLVAGGVVLVASPRGARGFGGKGLLTPSFFLALASGIIWTAGTVLLNRGLKGVDVLPAHAFRMGASALLQLPLLLVGMQAMRQREREPSTFWLLLLSGTLGSLSGFFWSVAVSRTTIAVAVVLNSTAPVFALPLGMLLRERIGRRNIQGLAMAVAGVWLLLL